MSPLDLILSKLPHARPSGHGYRAPCPAHGGDNPTAVSLSEGEDGATLLYCHSRGCTAEAIMGAIGLEPKDLFPEVHQIRALHALLRGLEVARLAALGYRQAAIARQLGVHRSTVCRDVARLLDARSHLRPSLFLR